MSSRTWCVVHTLPLKETLAQHHLLEQGYSVYLPRYKKIRRHARKTEEVLAPLFPRYEFVGIDFEKDRWRSINGTRGVSYLLMSSNEMTPATLPESIIDELRLHELSDGVVGLDSVCIFKPGDKVRILEGAFKEYPAVFDALDDKSRVELLLQFMGREMRVSLPSYAIEKD